MTDQPTCEHGITLGDLCAFASSRTEDDDRDDADRQEFHPAHVAAYAHAFARLRWQIHALRFAKEEGTLKGPDTFYNGVITAEALAREAVEQIEPDGSDPRDEALARIADLVAPAWRTNTGHEHDTTSEAFAAGRNEIIDAIRAILSDRTPDPRWMEGWLAAMDWLAEYKGGEGILLAEEMATRLPGDVLAKHQQEKR